MPGLIVMTFATEFGVGFYLDSVGIDLFESHAYVTTFGLTTVQWIKCVIRVKNDFIGLR